MYDARRELDRMVAWDAFDFDVNTWLTRRANFCDGVITRK